MKPRSSKAASKLGWFVIGTLLLLSQGCAQAAPTSIQASTFSPNTPQAPVDSPVPPTETSSPQKVNPSATLPPSTATPANLTTPPQFLARLSLGLIDIIALSPRRDWIAAAGGSDICLFDTERFEQAWCIPAELPPQFYVGVLADMSPSRIVESLAFQPEGKQIAAALWNGYLVFIDTTTGQRLNAFNIQHQFIYHVDWSQDGKQVYTWSREGGIEVWDTSTGEKVRRLDIDPAKLGFALAWSADKNLLAFRSEERMITVWDLATLEPVSSWEIQTPGGIYSLAFSPDGKTVYAGTATQGDCSGRCMEDESWVEAWNLTKGELVFKTDLSPDPKSSTDAMSSLAVSPDGRWVAGGGGYGRLMVFNSATGQLEAESTDINPRAGMAWLDDNRLLFGLYPSGVYGDLNQKSIRQLDMATGESSAILLPGFEYVYSLAWMLDGERLVTNSPDGAISIWQARTGQRQEQFQIISGDQPLNNFTPGSISPIDGRLAMPAEASVAIVDLETKEIIRILEQWHKNPDTHAWNINWSGDGKKLAGIISEHGDSVLAVWDVPTGKLLLTIPSDHSEMIISLALSPDGSRLAFSRSSPGNFRLVVWDISSNAEAISLDFPCPIMDLRWLNEDRILFEGAGGVEIWDLAQVKQVRTLTSAFSLTPSPDGSLAVSAKGHEGIVIWDFQSDEELANLKAESVDIRQLAFSPDGKLLASLNDHGSVIVWDVSAFYSK